MPQSTQLQREAVARAAGRILLAWRNGETAGLRQECELVRWLAAQPHGLKALARASSLEMERLEVLSAVVESLNTGRNQQAGAVRLLEQLATDCEFS